MSESGAARSDRRRGSMSPATSSALDLVAQRSEGALGRLVGLLAVVTLVGIGGALVLIRAAAPALEPDAVVVAPVRLTGAVDEELSARLTRLLSMGVDGRRGLRVVSARPPAWRPWLTGSEGVGGAASSLAGALEVARNSQAGWLLLGEAAGGPDRLSLTASLYSARTGGIEARVHAAGPLDSVPALVTRLVDGLESFDAALR